MQLGIYVPSRHKEFATLTPSKMTASWRSGDSILSFGSPRPRRGFREPFVEMQYPYAATAMYYLEKYESKKKPDLERLIKELEDGKTVLQEEFVGYAFRFIALPQKGVLAVASPGGPLNTSVAEEAILSILDMLLPPPNAFERFTPGNGDLKRLCEHYLQVLPHSEVYRVRATVEDVEVELKGSDVMKTEIYEKIDNATQIGSSPVEGAGFGWESNRVGRLVMMRLSAPEGRGVISLSVSHLTAEESVLLADEVVEILEDALGRTIPELVLGKAAEDVKLAGLEDTELQLPEVVPVNEIERKYPRDSRMVAAEIQRLMKLGYQMRFDNSRGRLLVAKQ